MNKSRLYEIMGKVNKVSLNEFIEDVNPIINSAELEEPEEIAIIPQQGSLITQEQEPVEPVESMEDITVNILLGYKPHNVGDASLGNQLPLK